MRIQLNGPTAPSAGATAGAAAQLWRWRTLATIVVALSCLAGAVPASATDTGGDGVWTRLQPPAKPSPRDMYGMASDPARQELVIFGGSEGTNNYLSETWTWDGTTWAQENPVKKPGKRILPAMAYDAARKQVVLFGGFDTYSADGYGTIFGDTWTWDGTNWTKHNPPVSPTNRVSASMAYDAARQKIVMFAGEGPKNGDFLQDTWTWDGAAWTEEKPTVSPPPRFDFDMTYDSASQQALLWGGRIDDPDPARPLGLKDADDTWAWDGKNWTEHHPTTIPPARSYHTLSYDPGADRVVLFGGWGDAGKFSDTWIWDGKNWRKRTNEALTSAPGPTATHRMRYVPSMRKHLLFGGSTSTSSTSDQTWTYALGNGIKPPVADFDGDRRTDVAVFRPSSGQWLARNNSAFPITYGTRTGDVPLPGDYDGDGITDVAIFRAGTWMVRGLAPVSYGTQTGDIPVPGDYDGNGTTDIAIFRSGYWYIRGNASPVTFGTKDGDVPVPADYDGNGTTDIAIFRRSSGEWFVRGNASPVTFGTKAGDVPVPADYDGNGTTDIAIFRSGTWYVANELGQVRSVVTYGTQPGDVAVPADYDRNGTADVAIFRASSGGQWYVRGNAAFPVTYGTQVGDIPLQVPYALRKAFPPASSSS